MSFPYIEADLDERMRIARKKLEEASEEIAQIEAMKAELENAERSK